MCSHRGAARRAVRPSPALPPFALQDWNLLPPPSFSLPPFPPPRQPRATLPPRLWLLSNRVVQPVSVSDLRDRLPALSTASPGSPVLWEVPAFPGRRLSDIPLCVHLVLSIHSSLVDARGSRLLGIVTGTAVSVAVPVPSQPLLPFLRGSVQKQDHRVRP